LKIAVLCRSESAPWHFPDGKTFLSPPGISGNNICSTAGRAPDGAATRFSCSTHGSVVGANQHKRSYHSQQPQECLRSFQGWLPPLLEVFFDQQSAEELAGQCVRGLLLHDFGANIIQDALGDPAAFPGIGVLRKRLTEKFISVFSPG